MSLCLNLRDKINTQLFEKNTPPAVIFESTYELTILSKILTKSFFNQSVDFVYGGEKQNLLNYHHSNHMSFKYLLLLKAEYQQYSREIKQDSNIVYSHFFDFHSYLSTIEVINKTIEDFKNVFSSNLDAQKILQEVHNLLQDIVAATVVIIENGWNIDLKAMNIRVFYNNEMDCFDRKRFSDHLYSVLASKGIDIGYDELLKQITKAVNNLSSFDYSKLVDGSTHIDILFSNMKKYFPSQLSNRDRDSFVYDLLKNIFECRFVLHLLREIDHKLKSL